MLKAINGNKVARAAIIGGVVGTTFLLAFIFVGIINRATLSYMTVIYGGRFLDYFSLGRSAALAFAGLFVFLPPFLIGRIVTEQKKSASDFASEAVSFSLAFIAAVIAAYHLVLAIALSGFGF